MNRQLLGQFGKFAFVGMIGFIVDIGITLTLVAMELSPFWARVFGIAIAVFATWRLNRSLTFGASKTSQASEGVRYFTVAIFFAMVNYAIYAALLLSIPALSPALAVLISVGFSSSLSFLGYRYFAFKTDA